MSKCRSPDRNPGNEGHSEGAENGHWDRAGEMNRTLYNRTKRFSVQSSHTRCLILILFSPCEVAEHKKSGVCMCVCVWQAVAPKRIRDITAREQDAMALTWTPAPDPGLLSLPYHLPPAPLRSAPLPAPLPAGILWSPLTPARAGVTLTAT